MLVENEFKKLKKFDLSYFKGKSHFEEDGTQNYLVFQPMYRYFEKISNTDYISSWKSKGISDQIIKPPTISDNSPAPELNFYGTKTRVRFTGSCLKQDKITYIHGKTVKVYTVYELNFSYSNSNYPTLEKSLFDAVICISYRYFGYGIAFDGGGTFSFPSDGFGCNIIIF